MKKIMVSMICLALLHSLGNPAVLAQDVDVADSAVAELAEHVPGELLIHFSPWMNSTQIANKMSSMGVTHQREIPGIGVHLVKIPPGLSVEQALLRFSGQPGIQFVEPNYILHIARANQAEIVDQWGLTKIRAQEAWATLDSTQKNEILIATVDTGIDSSRSDLSSRIWYFPGEIAGNGFDDDNNGYVDDTWGWNFVNNNNDPKDDNMHGTAVSSVMVAEQDGIGMVGVCPWCKVIAVKVMNAQGSGTLDAVANGITYAAQNGARVINLSLAGAVGAQTLEDAVNFAWNQGAVVVAGAGNNGTKSAMYPAGYANAMAVGSTSSADKHSCFSNYDNGYISVTAPGEAIYVIDINDPSGYGYYSGTSLSTPHVAGLAGLILGKDPGLLNSEVQSIIESSAVDLGPANLDAVFGYGRIDAYRAVTGDYSQVTPPDGLSSIDHTATGFANTRKMVRDGTGKLHLVWHTYDGSQYRIRYATSIDNGSSWDLQPDIFSSSNEESYHPALAADDDYLYVAFPSRSDANIPYQILFTRKPIAGGTWTTTVSLMGGTYNAVHPDIYVDPSNGRLHLIASSYDDSPYLYYRASNTQGATWEDLSQFNPSNSSSNTRYATIHANGDNIYVATKSVSNQIFFTYYYLYTARSTDGGLTWIDQTQISRYLAFTTSEYGVSLAGVGDRLYMAYEVGSFLFFRRYDGAGWSNYTELEVGDPENVYKWPTITQADDGQAWMLFEVNGQLYMRYYDGTNWQDKESVGPGTYANLKVGNGGGQVEWVYTTCNGSPFDLGYSSLSLGPNSPPQANDQNVATEEDTPLIITLSGSDPDGDPFTYSVVTGPSNGALSGNTPDLTYTPNSDFNGSDSFSFVVNDGQVDSNIATVTITVTPVNDSPVAKNDSFSGNENATINGDVLADNGNGPDSDVDGNLDPNSVSQVSGPSNGSLSLNGDGTFSYDPTPNFYGGDSFVYQVCDTALACDTALVTLTVNPINDSSVAVDDTYVTDEDTLLSVAAPGVLGNDTDADGDPLTAVLVSNVISGSLTLNSDGSFSYTPNPDFNGTDSFTYVANDGLFDSNIATVTLTVNAINDPPVAQDDSFSGNENATISGDVLTDNGNGPDSDVDGNLDPSSVSQVSGPSNGSLSLNSDGTFSYDPTPNFYGGDSFVYQVCDTGLACDTALVTLMVNPVNGQPVAVDDAYVTDEDTPLNVSAPGVLSNDTDLDGDQLTAVLVSDVISGSLSLNADGSFSYTPNPNFNGSDSFTYKANDGLADSNVAMVSITVDPATSIVIALASSEVSGAGTVNGNYTYTYADGGNLESITEIESGGKPQNRHSLLEHKWIFNVTPGIAVTLFANAWSSGSSDGDSFIFAYSTNDASYVDMFTVDYTADDVYATYTLPALIQGTVYVRVIDSDRSPGSRDLDTIYVDHMYIRSVTQPGSPPLAPTNLNATAVSATRIDLAWTDNATDEFGFQIERSLDGVGWAQVDTVGVDVTSYADTTVSPNNTYYYRVQAYNGSGTSGYSNTTNATTPDGLSLVAFGYKVKGIQMVDLTWSGGSANLFDIYRDGVQIASGEAGYTYTDNISQKGGGSYLYQVCEAGDQINCSNIERVDF